MPTIKRPSISFLKTLFAAVFHIQTSQPGALFQCSFRSRKILLWSIYGRHGRFRTADFYRVKVALSP
jgi:hypothetical protein